MTENDRLIYGEAISRMTATAGERESVREKNMAERDAKTGLGRKDGGEKEGEMREKGDAEKERTKEDSDEGKSRTVREKKVKEGKRSEKRLIGIVGVGLRCLYC